MLLTAPDKQYGNGHGKDKQKGDTHNECLLDQNTGYTNIQGFSRNFASGSSSKTLGSAQSTINLINTQEIQAFNNPDFTSIQKDIRTPIVLPYVRHLRRFSHGKISGSPQITSLNPTAPSFEATYPSHDIPFPAHFPSMWWNTCIWNVPPLEHLGQSNNLEMNHSLTSHINAVSSIASNQFQNTYGEQYLYRQFGEHYYNLPINLNGAYFANTPIQYSTLDPATRSFLNSAWVRLTDQDIPFTCHFDSAEFNKNFRDNSFLNQNYQYSICGSDVSDIFLRKISGTPTAISRKSGHYNCHINSFLRHGDGNNRSNSKKNNIKNINQDQNNAQNKMKQEQYISSTPNTYIDEMTQTSPCMISGEIRRFGASRTLYHKSPGAQNLDEKHGHIIIGKSPITTPDNPIYVKKCNIKTPLKISSRHSPKLCQLAEESAHQKLLRNREKSLSKMKLGLTTAKDINTETSTWLRETDPFTDYKSTSHPIFFLGKFKNSPNSRNTSGDVSVSCASYYQSPALFALVALGNRKPNINEILSSSPFVEYCRLATGDQFSVVKIENIPYSVDRSEILAFLGRNARIILENEHEPIHIIMDRITGKTLDCYVEFINFNEAINAINRFEQNRREGRCSRLGQRYVKVGLSTQECLMKDLFPKTKNIKWNGSVPKIIPRDPNDKFNSGFQGFITKEELLMLVKRVEFPQRVRK